MGTAVIDLDEDASWVHTQMKTFKKQLNQAPVPIWHPVKNGFAPDGAPCGEVLCSFSIVKKEYVFETPCKLMRLSRMVKTKDYQFDLNILGLRSLESMGLFPVKKAFIKFNVKNMLPPDKAQAVSNVATEPSSAGPNPNLNTMITFITQLPVDKLYCPVLSCEVYDQICKGWLQPKLGTFNVPVGGLMHK